MREKDKRMFDIFSEKRKPKNVIEWLEFKMWLALGVSPSKLWLYRLGAYEMEEGNGTREPTPKCGTRGRRNDG